MYKKVTKCLKFGKINYPRQLNEMLISNIIICVRQRVRYLRMHYCFFILNFFSYCVYCYFTFAYVDLHFKFIPQIP